MGKGRRLLTVLLLGKMEMETNFKIQFVFSIFLLTKHMMTTSF